MTSAKTGGSAFPRADDVSDSNEGMTLRQYAAIKLRVPDSGTDWLDDMIRQAKRDDFAGQALAGIAGGYWANTEMGGLNPRDLADEAYRMADAMIAARMGEQADE